VRGLCVRNGYNGYNNCNVTMVRNGSPCINSFLAFALCVRNGSPCINSFLAFELASLLLELVFGPTPLSWGLLSSVSINRDKSLRCRILAILGKTQRRLASQMLPGGDTKFSCRPPSVANNFKF